MLLIYQNRQKLNYFFLLINPYKKQLARKTTVNQLYQVYDKFDDAFNLEALGLAIWYVINVEHV